MNDLVLVIQTFVKADTLRGLCDSLLRCKLIETTHLIFWSDHPAGSRNESSYVALQKETIRFIKEFSAGNNQRFRSIEFHENDRNLGTCKTCEVAVDYGFSKGEFLIFTEDDAVFGEDALIWFSKMLTSDVFSSAKYWTIAGESVFFDARNGTVNETLIFDSKQIVKQHHLLNTYVSHNFVPSTCFATTRNKWIEFSKTRGRPCGDVDVCERCITEDKHSIFPVVPRIKDVGMLHELGYSVLINTKTNVMVHNKQTYLLSDMVEGSADIVNLDFIEFTGDGGALYRRTTLLEQYVEL